MKRKPILAFVVFALAAMNAFADFDYRPGNTSTPYDWKLSSLWYSNAAGSWSCANSLPTKNDNTWVSYSQMRASPLYINSGTAAEVKLFRLSNSSSTYSNPVMLTINGGSLVVYEEAQLGQKSAATLTIQNGGAFTGKKDTYIGFNNNGTGYTDFDAKVIVADANSSFTVSETSLFMGNQRAGLSLLENHGSVNISGNVYLGYYPDGRTLGEIISVIDNYGTMTQSATYRYYIGGTSGQTGVVTNHVGAAINGAYAFCVGSGSNTVGRLVNEGTMSVTRLGVGGHAYYGHAMNSNPDAYAEGWVENSGSINIGGIFRVGWQTNSVGHVENTGDIAGSNEFIMGYFPGSKGYFRHSAGTLTFNSANNSIMVGYQGHGYLELAGNTETVWDKTALHIASMANNSAGWHSSGELVMTNSASLSRGGKSVQAAVNQYTTARIALYDEASLVDVDTLRLGNVKTDNLFEVYDNAVVSITNLLVLNVGNTSDNVEGTTTMKLSGNARVSGFRNAYIGSNTYNRAVLEIADNAFFGLHDNAMNSDSEIYQENIKVAFGSGRNGNGTIRLRGGTIGLGNRGGLYLGDVTNDRKAGCPARLVGYGCVTNQATSGTIWSRLHLRSGSITADGEGEARDLDLRTFARVSGCLNGESADGRNYLNLSGTNGWYAINKGRLLYPARDSGSDTVKPRFVGDYARLDPDTLPKYVNSMRIILKDADGDELPMSQSRYPFVELYAPDRTDIPAGLVEDGEKSRRLGVWRGCMATSYANTARRSFTTAETTIRYDQWRLFGLKNGQGTYPAGLEVRLYRYDAAAGKWKRVARYPADEAEENGYRIGGDLEQADGVYNLGWFAVVAECAKGTAISIR